MRRLHLIEIHEQPWLPEIFRSMFRRFLGLFLTKTNTFKNAYPLFSDFLVKANAERVIDLCSGSGDAIKLLNDYHQKTNTDNKKIKLCMSDIYPEKDNHTILKTDSNITFYKSPIDILNLPEDIPKVRTIINALHHFTPDQVSKILSDAASQCNAIAIIEVTSRNWQSILFTLLSIIISPIAGAFFLRPYRFYHTVFSIFIPILPLMVLFDGIVSCLRSYTQKELMQIISASNYENFKWESGRVPSLGIKGLYVNYLFGYSTLGDQLNRKKT